MPYTIHTASARIKDANGQFQNIDVFSNNITQTANEILTSINTAKNNSIN